MFKYRSAFGFSVGSFAAFCVHIDMPQGRCSVLAYCAGFLCNDVLRGELAPWTQSIALTLNGEGRIMAVLPIFNLMRSVVDVHTFVLRGVAT